MSAEDSSALAVGIAGLGRAGWGLHAETLDRLRDRFTVVAATDPLPERLREASERFSCATYKNTSELIHDPAVRLAVLATPSHQHADQAIQALEAGKDVLVEKPFATSLADARRMLDAARASGRAVMGSQNLRFSADFLTVREVIASGRLGQIVQIRMAWHQFRRRWDWQALREFGGGALNNDGSHILDQALQLLGGRTPEVVCHMRRTPLNVGDTEDHVKVLLSAPDAPLVDVEFTNACAYAQEQWLVMGTAGTLTGGRGVFRWRYVDPALLAPRSAEREPTEGRAYNSEDLPWCEETRDCSTETYLMSLQRMYVAIHDMLRDAGPPVLTADSVYAQMVVLEECRRQHGEAYPR